MPTIKPNFIDLKLARIRVATAAAGFASVT
jgi:hypothetical protein